MLFAALRDAFHDWAVELIMNSNSNGAISMKSILKSIALLSAAVLVASCDSSSGGGSNNVATPPAPQTSTAGSGTKGIMVGADVVITDAAGAQLGQSTTDASGGYTVALDNSTQGGTITGPLTVTISGGQLTCDFDNDGTANDCPTGLPAPNNFVAFGQTYDAPAGFAIRSQIATPSTGVVSHVTPLSEIATLKAIESAGTSAPTQAQVTTALLALSGLVEALSGISLGGVDITQIQPVDLTSNTASASDAALVLGGLSASIIGAQGTNDLATTITQLAALVTIDANGNLSGTGTNLGTLTAAFARGLQVAATKSGKGTLAQAATNAANLATTYTNLGNATVTVPPLTPTGGTAAGAATKAFVTKLATVVGEVTVATGAQGAGEDGSVGATEAFAAELDAVARASSGNATIALAKISDAVLAASQTVVAGTPVENGSDDEDGITFTLAVDADGAFTLSNVSSTWPLADAAANKVTITVSDDTANTASAGTEGGEATSFSLTGVTMTTLNAAGTSVAQTFTGNISNTYDATAGTDTIAFDGTIATAATGTGSTFAIDIDAADVPRTGTGGTYTAVFTFEATGTANDLTLTLSGTIGASLQSYTIVSASGIGINGTVTRSGTTDVNTLSDGSATLTLTVTNGVVVADANGVIGTFTEGTGDAAATTATLNNTGVVTFTDGSILLLPSIIFIPDN